MIVIPLPYPDPPLRSNKRLHWRVEYKLKADIRLAGKIQAQSWMGQHARERGCRIDQLFPLPYRVHVRMVWSVPTRHRRDADAGQPTLKSYLDGVVDAGLLKDDAWQHVPRAYCEIEHRPGQPMGLRMEIIEVDAA